MFIISSNKKECTSICISTSARRNRWLEIDSVNLSRCLPKSLNYLLPSVNDGLIHQYLIDNNLQVIKLFYLDYQSLPGHCYFVKVLNHDGTPVHIWRSPVDKLQGHRHGPHDQYQPHVGRGQMIEGIHVT